MAGAFPVAARVELAVFALVGLLGGAHCLGMCGPLVTMYDDRMAGERPGTARQVRQHALFNLGRTAAYALVGALMGALGAAVFETAAVANAANGVRGVVGVLVGTLVVLTGLSYLRGGAGGPLARLERWSPAARVTDRLDEWVRGPRIAAFGALHALLPCPLLYPAYLYALARGDPVEGAVALAVLGAGTAPWLFAYGTTLGMAPARWRRAVHRGLGAAFVVLGYLPLSHGLVLLGVPAPLPPVHEFVYQPLDALVRAGRYCLP